MVEFRSFAQETKPCELLLRRAYDIANSYELVHMEFMNIKRMLSRNRYPNNFWTDAFSNSLTENTVSRNNVVHRLNPLLTRICFITTTVFGFYI